MIKLFCGFILKRSTRKFGWIRSYLRNTLQFIHPKSDAEQLLDSSHGIIFPLKYANITGAQNGCTKDLTQRTRNLSNTRFPGLVYLKNAEIKILTTRTTDFVAHQSKSLAYSLTLLVRSSPSVRSFVHSFVGSSAFRTRRNPGRTRSSKIFELYRRRPAVCNSIHMKVTTCTSWLSGTCSCTSVELPQNSVYTSPSSQSSSIDPRERVPRFFFFVNRAFCPSEEI